MSMTEPEVQLNLKHNLLVNILDGAFFGFALGFASFVTTIPLFVATMTESALLIGLIPAIHNLGWQLPQLATAYSVSRQPRYKSMVMKMTVFERLSFPLLAVVAWFIPVIGPKVALVLTFFLLIIQGLGAGFTATAWQSMIGKIMPSNLRGSFYGFQSAAANLLASLSAVLAGLVLTRMDTPKDFTLIFIFASLSMVVSYVFLALTREKSSHENVSTDSQQEFWQKTRSILRLNRDFRWFLLARVLGNFGMMAFAFYTVYAVKQLGVSEVKIGLMTSVYMATQIVANPIMGWLGDRWSHRRMMSIGMVSAAASALIAMWAPNPNWFFLVYILAGIGNVAFWTVGLAMVLLFGEPSEKPSYIGLANTLVAPTTIIAPLLAGLLVDVSGYPTAFLASAIGAILSALALVVLVKDPQQAAREHSFSNS
jgi:MFS family permease